ncbi:MAG: AAA family ATPase [Candidatus Competibacteraceae bacterium]|nr:AAA family ATPase [Candidatus Competibacteraceae bacterium]MCP5451503.1 AAA family ATPase [Gammaproteobacteria bacterium]HRX63147.1 AAA family ATPase [Candidatus Competibacter sp.]
MPRETRSWWIYQGHGDRNEDNALSPRLAHLGEPPPWRRFGKQARQDRGATFEPETAEIDRVNAALLLRRPLLVTGRPGTGKTSLTYAVAHELGLEPVLRWSITSRTTLQDGLYRYDAIGRLQGTSPADAREARLPEIGDYLTLGPLGTALFGRQHRTETSEILHYPRVLLIDEIDKSDIDMPNDLLHLFEEGEFEIPELGRLGRRQDGRNERSDEGFLIKPADYDNPASFQYRTKLFIPADGWVRCPTAAFPLVIMTSNGEREFPPAFMRRCLQLDMQLPDKGKLARIVAKHFALHPRYRQKIADIDQLIRSFVDRRDGNTDGKRQDLAADQLLNAVYLVLENIDPTHKLDKETLVEALWRPLSGGEGL